MRRHIVTIEEYDPGSELEGQPGEWSEVRNVWADIMPLTGTEYQLAQQMQQSVSHRIKTEFVAGMTPRMRLKYGERIFNAESVVNIGEANRELEWMCKEVV